MAAIDPKNTDDNLLVFFRNAAMPNDAKTAAEGRPCFDDVEVCEIRTPGSRNTTIQPATAVSHWVTDPITGGQTKLTYAERFRRQYRQFKEQQHQTIAGTPLDYAPFLTEARRAELRALNIYTVDQLAIVDGQELKNLGVGGRDLKNRAIEYLEEAKTKSVDTRLRAENEALRARLAVVEGDNDLLKQKTTAPPASNGAAAEDGFSDMTDEALVKFITTHAGHAPQGNLPRKTLVHMAQQLRPKESKAA
jgi:hypothetical protein